MKKQVNPVATAFALIAALACVLYVYTKFLLDKPESGDGGGGGGGGGGGPEPTLGLPSVRVSTLAGWAAPGFADGTGWDARFDGPAGLALAPDGSLYVADSRNHRIRRVTPRGVVTTVAGSGPIDCLPGGFADGPAETARFSNPTGLCVGPRGGLYIADAGNHRVRLLRNGQVTTVVGCATAEDQLGFQCGGSRDGPAAEARLKHPLDVALTPAGQLLIADFGNRAVRRVSAGVVSTEVLPSVAGPNGPAAIFASGETIVVADPEAPRLLRRTVEGWRPERIPTGPAAKRPTAVAKLPDGSLVIVDGEWNAVFALAPSGKSTLLAGTLPADGPASGVTDGTGDEALFAVPCAVVADGWTLYVADFGNNCLRKLDIPPDWATPPLPPDRREWWQQGGGRRERGKAGDRPDR